MIGALELDQRFRHAGQAISYLAAGVPAALLGIVAVVVLVVGAGLSVLGGLGLPLLLAGSSLCRTVVRLDRRMANRFLGTQIPPLAPAPRTSGTLWRRSLDLLGDRALLRMVTLVVAKPLLVGGLLVAGMLPVLLLAEILYLGIEGVAGLGNVDYFGPWAFGTVLGIVLLVLTIPAALLALAGLDALQKLLATISRALLVPRALHGEGPVREMLAESLGDRSVSIAYWLPDRQVFVDERGRPVQLPDPGSGRAWTAVERDGHRVAAIVHDAALDTSSELVTAAAAASSLAIDNERLKADLRARLEELRVSRLRIVEATDDARRRIERDLHDGAQQQLVALALELRLLKNQITQPGADELVDRLSERLAAALAELRELARGIHPAVLTERGLGPAVTQLADRASMVVDVDVQVEERLPAAVEAAAYFLVAEALTNITKYAQAGEARVSLRRERHDLVVVVVDDGIGGVDLDVGSGLRGLQDRIAAVDGTLTIASPPGGGTRLEARVPVAFGRPAPRPTPEEVGA